MLAPYLARLSHRQRLVLVGMLLSSAVVITIATVLVVATPTTGEATTTKNHPQGAKTQPLTLTSLPAPTATNTPAGTWAAPAPTFAQAIAFAPTAPATMLVCGSDKGALQLALSHDGGTTWAAYRASVAGQRCAVSVSPQDAKNMALTVTQCTGTCSATAPAALYRSTDGGTHWAQAPLPSGGFGGVMGWAGSTLYATTNDPSHPLAVSVNGADFALSDDIARFAGQITALMANGGTMLAVLQAATTDATPTPAASVSPTILESDNDGAVWSLVSLNDTPFIPTFICLANGGNLIGLEGPDTLVISRDAGATWQSAAPFTTGETIGSDHFAARAPDGTLVASLQSSSDGSNPAIFMLPSGASTWQSLTTPPKGAQLLGLSWNASGHPAALWASANGHLITDRI